MRIFEKGEAKASPFDFCGNQSVDVSGNYLLLQKLIRYTFWFIDDKVSNCPNIEVCKYLSTIERDEDKNFLAYNFTAKKRQFISATAETVDEAKRLLEEMLRVELGRENLSLAWQELGPLEDHQCRPGINNGASL